jgi:hypothetical protein
VFASLPLFAALSEIKQVNVNLVFPGKCLNKPSPKNLGKFHGLDEVVLTIHVIHMAWVVSAGILLNGNPILPQYFDDIFPIDLAFAQSDRP